jgi:hypothetical protein
MTLSLGFEPLPFIHYPVAVPTDLSRLRISRPILIYLFTLKRLKIFTNLGAPFYGILTISMSVSLLWNVVSPQCFVLIFSISDNFTPIQNNR